MLLSDLVSAFMLLTRLPLGWLPLWRLPLGQSLLRWLPLRWLPRDSLPAGRLGAAPDLSRCVWAFPVVGLVIGGLSGLAYGLCHSLGMPPLLASALALTAGMVSTGAFHEDGLADTMDGFGGGGTPERKLEIMRDSRIGSYGAAALMLSMIVRVTAVAGIDRPGRVTLAFVLAGMLGRGGMLLLPLLLSPARSGGMGAAIGTPRTLSVAAALGIALVATFVSAPAPLAAGIVLLALVTSLGVAGFARAQIGGYTGDVLGATEVAVECAVLSALASAFRV